MKHLKKGIYLTDIHFGKKGNSEVHNQDCINFLNWVSDIVKCDSSIEYVAFLGDWNENRSAINISTLKYSYEGAKILNDIGLPVYFLVGNHDIALKHSREIYSTIPYKEFKNFVMIDQPIIIHNIADGIFMTPYLFHDEYPSLAKYLNIPYWAGHFEFKDFIVTGYDVRMQTGPDMKDFSGPKYIVSGHYHKRQACDNIVYMGNTFPMDFGDAGDNDRGVMIYDHYADTMHFTNWIECPKYIKTKLSSLLDGDTQMHKFARVKCLVDIPISFEESTLLQKTFTNQYSLRDFVMEESLELANVLSDTISDIQSDEHALLNVGDLIVHMIKNINTEHINNDVLLDIYRNLRL